VLVRLALVSLLLLSIWRIPLAAKPQTPEGSDTLSSAKTAAAPFTTAPPSAMRQAELLYRNGKLNQAIAQYNSIIQDGSDTALAYASLARVYLKQGNTLRARSAATKALELAPLLPASHVALGEVYYREGELAKSEEEFLNALDQNGDEVLALFGLARLYRAEFDERSWKQAIEKAHLLDPDDREIARDWVQTRPAEEQMRFLETSIARGTYGDRVLQAEARQSLAILKDQELHPERTCRVFTDFEGSAEIPLERYLRTGTSGGAQNAEIYPGAGLNALVDGRSTQLVLSTSGERIILNGNMARKLNVREITRVDIEGLGDQNPPEGYMGFVESIRIGKIEFHNCYVMVAENATRDNFFKNFDGAIGLGLFSAFLVEVDLPRLKLKLSELPALPSDLSTEPLGPSSIQSEHGSFAKRRVAPSKSNWTPIYRFSDNLLVPATIDRSIPRLFNISTGATNSLVSTNAAQALNLTMIGQVGATNGLNGKLNKIFNTDVVQVRFAGVTSRRLSLATVDFSAHSQALGTELSGALGFDLLGSLDFTIDFRDGLIKFE